MSAWLDKETPMSKLGNNSPSKAGKKGRRGRKEEKEKGKKRNEEKIGGNLTFKESSSLACVQ